MYALYDLAGLCSAYLRKFILILDFMKIFEIVMPNIFEQILVYDLSYSFILLYVTFNYSICTSGKGHCHCFASFSPKKFMLPQHVVYQLPQHVVRTRKWCHDCLWHSSIHSHSNPDIKGVLKRALNNPTNHSSLIPTTTTTTTHRSCPCVHHTTCTVGLHADHCMLHVVAPDRAGFWRQTTPWLQLGQPNQPKHFRSVRLLQPE